MAGENECQNNSSLIPNPACKLYVGEVTGEIKTCLNTNMQDLRERLIKIDDGLDANTKQTEKLSKIVIGNGVKGLAETSREFEKHIKEHNKKEGRTLKVVGAMLLVVWQILATVAIGYLIKDARKAEVPEKPEVTKLAFMR